MKSKGFTLTEILAVIVILAVLIAFAVPNVVGIGNNSRTKMYCTKIQNIESAAQQYAEANFDTVERNNNFQMTIRDLVNNGYFKKEDDTCDFSSSKPCVTDPRDKSSIDNQKVKIEIKNRRPYATYLGDKTPCTN